MRVKKEKKVREMTVMKVFNISKRIERDKRKEV